MLIEQFRVNNRVPIKFNIRYAVFIFVAIMSWKENISPLCDQRYHFF